MRTQAESDMLAAFAQARDSLPGSDVVRGARTRAFDHFHERGLPHRRIEAWHYTDLRALMRKACAPAVAAPMAATSGVKIVIRDGRASVAAGGLPAGLTITALRDLLPKADEAFVKALYPEQGSDDAMIAYNTALASDGVVIDVAAGVALAQPIELSVVSSAVEQAEVSRSLVRLGAGARASLYEAHGAASGVQRNSALVIELAAGAELNHVFETQETAPELHIASLIADLGEAARLQSFGFVTSGAVLRRQMFVRGSGENARIALRGVNLLNGKQHADTTIVVDHAVPHGESRELFKSILDGEATCVFQGKVVVRPHAQKTDGGMKSQALLLSDDAAMYNKPELEIFADDVVCGHGATVGQLDGDQLFYLMARGLPRKEAEALLIEGFAREALDFVVDEPLRERLETALSGWLGRRI
jgi:Fe-S cluster assembly protein SufD